MAADLNRQHSKINHHKLNTEPNRMKALYRLFAFESVGVVGGVGRVVAGQGSRSSADGDSYTVHPEDLDMANTTFDRPDLSAFTRLDGPGLEVTGQRIEPGHAVLACRITGEDRWCRRCGCQGISGSSELNVGDRVLVGRCG